MMLRPKTRVGPYRIERRLAAGGMAEVYVAHREAAHGFERRVALKTILPQFASDPDLVEMFADEARLAARLEHPAIAQVFDFGQDRGIVYLAMELVEGASVNRLIRAAAAPREAVALPLSVILHVGIEVARALAYAHHARDAHGRPLGVVHRDVSPANILLGRRGEVKLVDFGIARCLGAVHRTDDGMVRGKLGYMSPEQVQGKPLDGKSDVFTLATVLAEMCLLEPLFGSGEDLSILTRIRDVDLSPLDRLFATAERSGRERTRASSPPEPPVEFLRLLGAALARRPEQRIEASRFADALEQIAERRGLSGRRAHDTARMLHRLGLLALDAADLEAREPGARPTALVSTDSRNPTGTTARPGPAGTHELLSAIALEPPVLYEIVAGDGRVVGPLSYAELVRRIVAGELGADVAIRREGGDGEPPELRRYLASRAFGWRESAPRNAREHGTLEGGRLLGVALRIATSRATGMLELVEEAADPGRKPRRKRIFYVDGKPEFVGSNDPAELLGEVLVREGVCLRMELEMALAVLDRFDGRLTDALVGLGVVRPLALVRALERQVRERYLEAFRWRRGTWTFVPGLRSGEEVVPLGRSALELLHDAVVGLDAAHVEALLEPWREKVLTRVEHPPAPAAALGLSEPWLRAIEAADGRSPLAVLAMRASTEQGLDLDDAQRAFCLGLACSLVRVAETA